LARWHFGRIARNLAVSRTSLDASSPTSILPLIRAFTKDILRVITELGYEEDKQVTQLFGDGGCCSTDPAFGRHIDVFFNDPRLQP